MSLIRDLTGNPEWQALLKSAEKIKPVLPEWDPTKDNVEEWKEKSAMRAGFDLCLALFKPRS